MKYYIIIVISVLLFFSGCQPKNDIVISVKNDLNFERIQETVEIIYKDLSPSWKGLSISVVNKQTNEVMISQNIDENGDGKPDVLIFQTDFSANEEKVFFLKSGDLLKEEQKSKVYARFVPERKDDFAWENDRIAFRMYGPALEAEEGDKISSGIDVWTKSVNKLVLDEWYKGDDYHKDHGEGLDYYKVGASRGCGGIGILQSGSLLVSRNFSKWKIIANGPVRTIFELTYAPWGLKDKPVSEVKRISLDAGRNLNHFQSFFESEGNSDLMQFAVGISKREAGGESKVDKEGKILRYWEPEHPEFGICGCAVVIPPSANFEYLETKDHYLVKTSPGDNSLEYYAGACWNKNEAFKTVESWDSYLKTYAETLKSPLKVSVIKN